MGKAYYGVDIMEDHRKEVDAISLTRTIGGMTEVEIGGTGVNVEILNVLRSRGWKLLGQFEPVKNLDWDDDAEGFVTKGPLKVEGTFRLVRSGVEMTEQQFKDEVADIALSL